MLISQLIIVLCDPGYNAFNELAANFDAMKPKIYFRTGVPLLLAFFLHACVWDNMEELYPDIADCDTSSVSFSMDVIPILSDNCFSCHSKLNAPASGGGLSLEDHQDVARSSDRIIGAINHEDGFQAMPRGGDKLDPCSINVFEAWAHAGAPDN